MLKQAVDIKIRARNAPSNVILEYSSSKELFILSWVEACNHISNFKNGYIGTDLWLDYTDLRLQEDSAA